MRVAHEAPFAFTTTTEAMSRLFSILASSLLYRPTYIPIARCSVPSCVGPLDDSWENGLDEFGFKRFGHCDCGVQRRTMQPQQEVTSRWHAQAGRWSVHRCTAQ